MDITKRNVLQLIQDKQLDYKPNQDKISLPIINRIYKKMSKSIIFPPIKISGDLIIDGHHRYISAVLANFDIGIIKDYPRPSYLNNFDWKDVTVLEDDFDTQIKIKLLNQEDAKYNNLDYDDILEIIK